jgi:hypothetical protein
MLIKNNKNNKGNNNNNSNANYVLHNVVHRLYQVVLYFKNAIRFYGAQVAVISFTPASLPCADFTEALLSSIMLGFLIKIFT